MKLAIDPENVKWTEVDDLASNDLVQEITNIIHLDKALQNELRTTLQQVYHAFLSAYYDVSKALPEHEEKLLLSEVRESAWQLLRSLNNLFEKGNTDQRLGDSLKDFHQEQFKMHQAIGDKSHHLDPYNPNFNLRRLIGNIVAASETAIDKPHCPRTTEELNLALKKETDPDRLQKIETELFWVDFADEHDPNRHEEYKERVKSRRVPKDLPIRNSIKQLKEFFDIHVDIPFTAGKYYPEIGFKSSAFYAVKTVLKKIYPEVSDRKIASIMQEVASGNGYNFPSENEGKTCSTD